MNELPPIDLPKPAHRHPFRRAVFRGMGLVLPPILTIVIFVWAAQTVQVYVLEPVTRLARDTLVWQLAEIHTELPGATALVNDATIVEWHGRQYKRTGADEFVPLEVYSLVRKQAVARSVPLTAEGIYGRYVELTYLRPWIVVPVFLVVFLLAMYVVGRFLAAGIGRVLWNLCERLIDRLPLVRNVYSSVKQVTDFVVNDREVEFTRVVAVEYPRKGIYSLAFVTGEGMRDVCQQAGDAVVSILIPTSPMPVTGYTMMVAKSELIDLDLTVDQALQFIISCGVVIPPHQLRGRFKTVA